MRIGIYTTFYRSHALVLVFLHTFIQNRHSRRVTATKLINTLVPKLLLGNPVVEAPASRDGKLESFDRLFTLNSHAGALVVIHNFVRESSYWQGCRYPVPWTVTWNLQVLDQCEVPADSFTSLCLGSGIPAGTTASFRHLCITTRAGAELARTTLRRRVESG